MGVFRVTPDREINCFNHRLSTFLRPDFGEVFQEGLAEYRAAAERSATRPHTTIHMFGWLKEPFLLFPSVNQRLIADVEFQRAGPLSALEPAAFAAGSVVGRAPLARPRRHQQHYPHADRADDRAANHESKQRAQHGRALSR
jgi:hypothetical protein